MSDESLRELERRWRATGSRADELAFRRERIRWATTEIERRRFTIEAFAPELLRDRLVAFLDERLALIQVDRHFTNAWQGELLRDVHKFVSGLPEVASWFVREISTTFVAWGQPPFGHGVSPQFIDPEPAADNIVQQFAEVRRCHLALLDLLEAPLPMGDTTRFDEALRAAVVRITDFVVAQTVCEDSWYETVWDVFAMFLNAKEVHLPEVTWNELRATSLRVHFESWIAPTAERVQLAADGTSLAIVRALFDERYGRE
ncbi:MAG TPA: hypothetical protein VFF73_28770 [Planctomycetota bacterium]|nr:hypothetical protein [Planctomycetota bacterium]